MGIIRYIKEEFRVITERDPAIKTPMEVLLYPSFRAILSYRLAHRWYLKGHYFWARWLPADGAQDRHRDTPGRYHWTGTVY